MRRLAAYLPLRYVALLLAALGFSGLPVAVRAQQAQVGVSITLNGDSGEIIGAWRRAKGIDPPDARADRRYAELVERVRGPRASGGDPQRIAATMNRLIAATPAVPQLRLLRRGGQP